MITEYAYLSMRYVVSVSVAWLFSTWCLALSAAPVGKPSVDRNGVYLAPGWGKLSFAAPAVGSYSLPVLDTAEGGALLNTHGDVVDLSELIGEKVTLLSFVYRTCDDVNGCPLSTMVLYTVADRLSQQIELRDQLRLVTISFDPNGDTPEAMAEYADSIVGDAALDWHFLTSESEAQVQPVLDAYQQSVVPDTKSVDGKGKFSHILRVYLIDQQAQIRNIYSLSFLHPDILVNDIKTLIMEQSNGDINKRGVAVKGAPSNVAQ